tara:strand:+ start:57 stop:332 length:276 start_codon:yes stop_codon:yes gene_type:complete
MNSLRRKTMDMLEAGFSDGASFSYKENSEGGLDLTVGNATELGHLVGETYTYVLQKEFLGRLEPLEDIVAPLTDRLLIGLARKMWLGGGIH